MNSSGFCLTFVEFHESSGDMSLARPLIPDAPDPAGESTASNYTDPFAYRPPSDPYLPLIFASPHSGTRYPQTMRDALSVPLMDLRRIEDAYIDEIFASAIGEGAGYLTANYARSFVDLNRDPLELDKHMFDGRPPRPCGRPGPRVEAGLGCLPRVGARGADIYRKRLSPEEGEARLRDIHDTYHGLLGDELTRLAAGTGSAFLIDCHSMPSRVTGRRPLADIVLGDRFASSCSPKLSRLVEKAFRDRGYRVARNAPYAGGFTTRRYGRPYLGRHALQIEIRRDLYMDETRVAKTRDCLGLAADVSGVVAEIAAFVRHQVRR